MREDSEESAGSMNTDDVPEGIESRRKVAEWAAEGWQQRANWGSCLDWIAEQWGAVEGTGPLQDLLGQLQFGIRVGLKWDCMVHGVLLWQQRQHSFGLATKQWQRQQSSQEGGVRAADRCPGSRQRAVLAADLAGDTQQQRICLPDKAERAGRQGAGGFWSYLGGAAAAHQLRLVWQQMVQQQGKITLVGRDRSPGQM